MAIFEPCTAGALMTVQTVTVCAAAGLLANVMLHPGTAASSVTIYDNATAGSGTILCTLLGTANGATVLFPFSPAVFFRNGLTCVVTGTGAQAQVYYQLEF